MHGGTGGGDGLLLAIDKVAAEDYQTYIDSGLLLLFTFRFTTSEIIPDSGTNSTRAGGEGVGVGVAVVAVAVVVVPAVVVAGLLITAECVMEFNTKVDLYLSC